MERSQERKDRVKRTESYSTVACLMLTNESKFEIERLERKWNGVLKEKTECSRT